MTTPTASSSPTGLHIPYLGINQTNPGNNWYRKRAPTTKDFQNYQVLDRWINKLTGFIYFLQSKTSGVATWIQIGTSSGGIVQPSAGGTGVATATGLLYANGTAPMAGIVPTTTSGAAASPQVLNNRAGTITFTGVSIAAGATLTLTNTNSSITAGTTQILYSLSGVTTGAALSVQSVTPNVGTVAYVITNGTGATTSTANIVITFLVLN